LNPAGGLARPGPVFAQPAGGAARADARVSRGPRPAPRRPAHGGGTPSPGWLLAGRGRPAHAAQQGGRRRTSLPRHEAVTRVAPPSGPRVSDDPRASGHGRAGAAPERGSRRLPGRPRVGRRGGGLLRRPRPAGPAGPTPAPPLTPTLRPRFGGEGGRICPPLP